MDQKQLQDMQVATTQAITLDRAVALLETMREALQSVNGAFDKPFSEEIAQANALIKQYKATDKTYTTQHIIGPWWSERYGHADSQRGPDFDVDVINRLDSSGQAYIDMRPDGGNVDDLLSTMVEVSAHPETRQAVPVVRVHRGDECVASIYADGMDKALLVVSRSDLQDGLLRITEN